MRKTLYPVLLLIGLLTLAACGGNPPSPNTGSRNTPTGTNSGGPGDTMLGVYFGSGIPAADGSSDFYALNAGDGTLHWKVSITTDTLLSPVLANGVIYLSTQGGVSAFKASDGSRVWQQNIGRATIDAVAGNTVYGTAFTGTAPVVTVIYALNATSGKLLWESRQPGGFVERAANGVVYVGFTPMAAFGASGLSALNASNGKLLWHYAGGQNVTLRDLVNGQAEVNVYAQPASASDLPLGFVAALDLKTGKELWRFQPSNKGTVWEIGATDQTVYVLSNDGNQGSQPTIIYALNASTGAKLWNKQGQESQFSAYSLEDGILYLGAPDNVVTALSASDGSMKWHTQVATPNPANGSGTAAAFQSANGLLYYAIENQAVYTLNPSDGSMKWQAQVPGEQSVLAVTSTTLYVSANTADQMSSVTAYNSTDGSVRWTYQGMSLEVGSAAVG